MMASNSGRPNTTTTTTTSTSITVSHSRRPRSSSQNLAQPSASSSRNHIAITNNDRFQSPRASHINSSTTSTEPFPPIQNEPLRTPQLSSVQTMDHYPLSVTVSSVSQQAPTTTVATQIRRRPIGIKRLSTNDRRDRPTSESVQPSVSLTTPGRRRSTSAPQRPILLENAQDGGPLQHSFTAASNLPALVEGRESSPYRGADEERRGSLPLSRPRLGSQRLRRASDAARSAVSRLSNRSDEAQHIGDEYNPEIVDVLDVLDPEVSTLTTLTNVQNSLFVPDLGWLVNRRPTYELTKGPSYRSQRPTLNRGSSKPLPPTPMPGPIPPKDPGFAIPSDIDEETDSSVRDRRLSAVPSIASVIQEEHYAVLPHGVSLEGWSDEDKELLDDHVRHMLHSKREGFKRSMRAFGKYVRKPLGFFVTLYATLITLFGLAWVLFLIGWIYVGERQSYIINIIDNVLVALFAIIGDGMAPFRAVDTYHMAFIAYYHHQTEKIRKKRNLPKLQDHNELPEIHETEVDVEASLNKGDAEFSVLTPEQQAKLEHHQNKFSKSHSFYKPHETTTHRAFPHHLFVAIVLLLDMHSCLQISLGSCTWGISYHTRPQALTPTILSCSITVNILAGILIKVGDNKTRKKDVLKRMFRQQLTEEAMRKVEKHKIQSSEGIRSVGGREKGQTDDHIREESESNRFSTITEKLPPEEPNKIA